MHRRNSQVRPTLGVRPPTGIKLWVPTKIITGQGGGGPGLRSVFKTKVSIASFYGILNMCVYDVTRLQSQ